MRAMALITDKTFLADIAEQWAAVRKLTAAEQNVSIVGTMIYAPGVPDGFHNLPLVLAFSVLEQVLEELVTEGAVPKPEARSLYHRMVASKEVLPWQDYALVDAGRLERNALAHKAQLATKANCKRFIDAIEDELKAWQVL